MRIDFTPMLSPALAETIGGIHEPARSPETERSSTPATRGGGNGSKPRASDDPELDGTADEHSRRTGLSKQRAAVAGQGVAILTPEFYPEDVALGKLYQPFELRAATDTTTGSPIRKAAATSRRSGPSATGS